MKKLDCFFLRLFLYQVAFLQNDAAGMAQEVDGTAGKPEAEGLLLQAEADTAAYSGRLRQAREFSRRAIAAVERAKMKELVAWREAISATREALFGNAVEAQATGHSGSGPFDGSGCAVWGGACTGFGRGCRPSTGANG